MKPVRLAAAAAAVVALAVPAIASAHPSVYTDTNRSDSDPGPGYTEVIQTRYVVANHGFTYVLRETNSRATSGVMDYSDLPAGYRATLPTMQDLLDEATGAQAHATCWDSDGTIDGDAVEALWDPDNIAGWQDTAAPIEPFYAYVPFQKAAAGLEDDPAAWLDDVQTLVGVNLSTVSSDPATAATELAALCNGIQGGTFVAADTTQSSFTAFNSGTIEQTAAPLEAHITTLEAEKAAAVQAAATADAAAKAATNRAIAAEAALAAEKKPLTVKLADSRQAAKQVANRGAKVELTGPPARKVKVKLVISSARAKALGLKSNVLGSETVTTDDEGAGSVTVDVSNKAEKALKNLKSALKLSVSAVAGDRADSAGGTLTR